MAQTNLPGEGIGTDIAPPHDAFINVRLSQTMVHILFLLLSVFLPIWKAGNALAGEEVFLIERMALRSTPQEANCILPSKFGLAGSSRIRPLSSKCEMQERLPFGRVNIAYSRKDSKHGSVPNLRNGFKPENESLMKLSGTTPILDNRLSAGIDFMYHDSSGEKKKELSQDQRLGLKFLLKGSMAGMKYGAELQYFGKESPKPTGSSPQDRSGGMVFWEWDFHNLKHKAEISRYIDNLEKDPSRARTMTTTEKISLNWGLPQWPRIGLGYTHEEKETMLNPIGLATTSLYTDKVSAKISHWNTSWETYLNVNSADLLTIGFSLSRKFQPFDPFQFTPKLGISRTTKPQKKLITDRYFAKLGSSLQIAETLTLKPTLEYTQVFNRLAALQTETISAKLSSSYNENKKSLSMSFSGGLKIQQDSNDLTNMHTYNFVLSIQRGLYDFLNLPHQTQSLSLKLTHNQKINYLNRVASTAQTSAMLMLDIIP